MTKTRTWHTKAIYLFVALAFVLGMALVPGTGRAADTYEAPYLSVPSIDYNVKGTIHKVCVNATDFDITLANIDWWLEAGVNIAPNDVTVLSPSPDPGVKVYGTSDNVTCIELRAMKRGDIHIFVEVTYDEETWTLTTEKKWGEIVCTELDVDAETSAVDNTEAVEFPYDYEGLYEEVLKDEVYARFLEVPGNVPVDGAIVHWWLVEDTDENQDFIDELMDYLAAHNPDGYGCVDPDHWAACGKYLITDELLGGKQPWEYINDWVTDPADPKYADPNIFDWDAIDPDDPDGEIVESWYAWNTSVDGEAFATLTVDVDEMEPCEWYDIMIVVLVSYPSGTTPQEDPFNGENIICVEKGKKSFHLKERPEISEVKTTQLRWAGEKIVLEKDWSDLISGNYSDYVAEYNLEFESVGTLHPATPSDFGFSEGKVFAFLDSHGVSRCILESEQAGEADVDVALYPERIFVIDQTGEIAVDTQGTGPIIEGEIGFLVYFLEFEDITLAEDITPPESLEDLEPDIDDADVAVRVRGFFPYEYSHLLPTNRDWEPVDLNGDDEIDKWLPFGRYVLPDDWWLLAETEDIDLRPWYDLMDQANLDDIVSLNELGPYDSDVRTTTPPGEAEYPCIGPFSSLQQWSILDMWIALATVPSSLPLDFVRNTVVPNGTIDEWDAPMPQALVLFEIVFETEDAALSDLDKGDLADYGISGLLYQSPFYAVEIPASPFIPPAGYNWDSWGVDEPYDYWTDLTLASIISNTQEDPIDDKDVEVYCDNHGIAGVTIDALDDMGMVVITATAEFPYTPKRGKYGPRVTEIPVNWGQELIHLNPDFEADPRSGDPPLDVDFDPSLTTQGTPPYVRAQWDFNGDSIIDEDVSGSWATPADIPATSFTYDNPGIYTVRLTITDSTLPPLGPLVHTEEKIGYIEVYGVFNVIWNCPIGGEPLIAPNPGAGRPVLNVAADCEDITVSGGEEIWGIFYLVEDPLSPDFGTWLWYVPGFVTSTLTELVPGDLYFVVVSDACTLTIPQS